MRMIGKFSLVLAPVAAAATALLTSTAAIAATATTAPPQLKVQLYANGDSTATWDLNGHVVLTAGTDAGTSAQVLIPSAAGHLAPSTAPTFDVTGATGGDPRWVIEFHNGQILDDNGSGTATGWSCALTGVNGTYATALASCEAGGLDDWVTAAFIVADAGVPHHPWTLTGIQYGGAVLQTYLTRAGEAKNAASGKCMTVVSSKISQDPCVTGKAAQQFRIVTVLGNGIQMLEAATPQVAIVSAPGKGAQLALASAFGKSSVFAVSGAYAAFPAQGLVAEVTSTTSGTPVIGAPKNGGANQRWSLP